MSDEAYNSSDYDFITPDTPDVDALVEAVDAVVRDFAAAGSCYGADTWDEWQSRDYEDKLRPALTALADLARKAVTTTQEGAYEGLADRLLNGNVGMAEAYVLLVAILADLDAANARCADCTTEHLSAQARVEDLEKERDMLAVMGADLDAETTNAGSTPEDWISEAKRRNARVDDLCAAAREAVTR